MPEQVAIDNDFLQHLLGITSYPKAEDLYQAICRFFSALDVSPAMHPLVYEKETCDSLNDVGKKLFDDGIVGVESFQTFLSGDAVKRQYYETMVQAIYQDFMGVPYPCKDMFNEWQCQKSLGEVHTVVMCVFLGWNCFLSDDKDVARDLGGIVHSRMTHPINVYNRQACCERLKGKTPDQRCGLTSKDIGYLSHTRCN